MRVNEKKTRIKEDVIQIEDLKKGGAEVWKVFLLSWNKGLECI
jgi:hypothetical protein